MSSEVDTIVHKYLLSVSAKLAKQFAKKKPSSTSPWTGPGIEQLIDFYKRNCKEIPDPTGAANGSADTKPESNGTIKVKKGKKRKLCELEESITEPTPPIITNQTSTEKKKKKKKKKKENNVLDVVEVIQVSEDKPTSEVETPVAVEAVAEDTAVDVQDQSSADEAVTGGLVGADVKLKKKSKLKRSGSSFRRVKEEDIVIKKKELTDNTFEAKQGADDYGFKANQILKFTKGKSFRHEKTKKKRGTYKGGAINMGVTSIKFDSDSE